MEKLLKVRSLSAHSREGARSSIPHQNSVIPSECFMVLDLVANKIKRQFGLHTFIGVSRLDVGLEALKQRVHPDDIDYVNQVFESVLFQEGFTREQLNANILNICYRFKRDESEYNYLLNRVYVTSITEEGRLEEILIKYEDISFISTSQKIAWETNHLQTELEELWKHRLHDVNEIFTSRELDIAKEIVQGKTNHQISANLHISYHTVTTHRKHIFKKAGCHSPSELIMFFHKKGALV